MVADKIISLNVRGISNYKKGVQFSPGVGNKRRMLYFCKKHTLVKGTRLHGGENGERHCFILLGQTMHGYIANPNCTFCNEVLETIQHFLFYCAISQAFWNAGA